MRPSRILLFVLQSVTAGLAAAFIVVLLNPALAPHFRTALLGLFDGNRPAEPIITPAGPRPQHLLSYASTVESAAPAVVNIYTAKLVSESPNPLLEDPLVRRFFGIPKPAPQKRLERALGSGVIVSPEGYVLTNNHVIAGAQEIRVGLRDGRAALASVVGTDPETDLAVLRINLDDLPSIRIGRAQDLRVGDIVLAIGNPFGFGQTVTQGIVSATGRNGLGINTFESFIQTDAAINPGNSGGALVNLRGDLVGINTAIFSKSGGSQGIGFAIPMNIATDVLQQLVRTGHVVRGWLGIEARTFTPQLARTVGLPPANGVLIVGVLSNGPAARAGLLPGDVLTDIVGQPVHDAHQAVATISAIDPGTHVRLGVLRHGQAVSLLATVGSRPQITPAQTRP